MHARHIRRASLIAALVAGPVFAQQVIYPSKGQSPEQQQKDEGECHTWAVKQSGVDPAAVASQSAAAQPKGGAARGAARGAAGGAIGGAIAGDAGKGAAIGAAVGGGAGAARQRRGAKEQQAATQQAMDSYNKARTACLEGRGYVVK
jgi:hypothetical protein